MADVIILMGSNSDLPVVEQCYDSLKSFGISVEMRIASAQRTPAAVSDIVAKGHEAGTKVFICAAGGAASLAGTVAALTSRPVIGIPLTAGALGGIDALYSTVNSVPGTPIATVSVGTWGAKNAAILAAQILALNDEELAGKVEAARQANTEATLAKDQDLQARLNGEQEEA